MNYIFYKNLSNTRRKISSLEPDIIDLRSMFAYTFEVENKLPKSMQETLLLMRRNLNLKELPFTLLSEDMIRELNWPQNWESMLFIIPKDVDYIYEFSIDDSSFEGIDMNVNVNVEKQQTFDDGSIDDFPKIIDMADERLEYFHLSRFKDNKKSKRFFLFIRNWARKTSALFRKYKPRFYELNSNLLDNELRDFTYKQIPISDSDKPVAVIVHGFMSFTEENFTELKRSLVESKEYSQIFGYSYPPNKIGIRDNGSELLKILGDTGLLYSKRKIDLYAHSEGGLVCRSMIVRDLKNVSLSKLNIRHLITAGTPHLGTPIAEFGLSFCTMPQLAIYISNTFIESCINGTSLESIKVLKKLILHHYLRRTKHLGLKDMIPNSDFLLDLQQRCTDDQFNISGSVILASYELEDYSNFSMPIRKLLTALDNVFNHEKYDGVVPKLSSEYKFTESKPMVLVNETEGWHSEYFGIDVKAKNIVNTVVSLKKVPTSI